LNSDSDVPQVGSARSDWTRVVKVNRRKMNHHKTRPCCTLVKFMVQIIAMQLVHFSSYDNADNLIALLSGYNSADQNMIYVDWNETVHLTPVRRKSQGDQRGLMCGR